MKPAKQYKVRLTQEEDALLKQKARDIGLSAADIIRMGIRYVVGEKEFDSLMQNRLTALKENSEFIKNWEVTFGQAIFQEFQQKWQDKLQTAYLHTLNEYKDFVHHTNGKFVLSLIEAETSQTSSDATSSEEIQTEIPEHKVREDICDFLTKSLGGEWNGDESIVLIFLTGLKADLAAGQV